MTGVFGVWDPASDKCSRRATGGWLPGSSRSSVACFGHVYRGRRAQWCIGPDGPGERDRPATTDLPITMRLATLIVHTRDDPLVSYEAAERAAGRIPGARLLSLETGGHLLLGQTDGVRRDDPPWSLRNRFSHPDVGVRTDSRSTSVPTPCPFSRSR